MCVIIIVRCPNVTVLSGCLSIYVRHGDKFKEMALLDWGQYLSHAEIMVRQSTSQSQSLRQSESEANHVVLKVNRNYTVASLSGANHTAAGLRRCAFLSTEDHNVVDEAKGPITRRAAGWNVSVCEEVRNVVYAHHAQDCYKRRARPPARKVVYDSKWHKGISSSRNPPPPTLPKGATNPPAT